MSSMITNIAPTKASGEPDPGIVQNYKARLQALHAHTAAHSVPSITGKTVSPHLLRHACAVHTLEATGDVRKVSLWLGHSSLQATEMYLRADPTDKPGYARQMAPSQPPEGQVQGCAGRVARNARRRLNPPILWKPDSC